MSAAAFSRQRRLYLQDTLKNVGMGVIGPVAAPGATSRLDQSFSQASRPQTKLRAGRKMGIGIALSAGAARGLAHIGVLQALSEAAIPVRFIAGCSAGAFIGALYAAGISPWQLRDLALRTRDIDLIDFDNSSKNSLISGVLLQKFVNQAVGHKKIEEFNHRFACIATDLDTGKAVILRSGDAGKAVRASCAIPSLFTPVSIGTTTLVDGGLVSPLPIEVVRNMGAEHVIASSVAGNVKAMREKGFYDMVLQSFEVMTRSLIQLQAMNATLTVSPPVDQFSNIDFSARAELIEAGYEAGRKSIPAIRNLIST